MSQSWSRLKILSAWRTVHEVALISNVMTMGKSMHKGVRWVTQDDKETLSYLENSSATASRRSYHRGKINISSALTFCRLSQPAPSGSEKKSLQLPSHIHILSMYCPPIFSSNLVFGTGPHDKIVK